MRTANDRRPHQIAALSRLTAQKYRCIHWAVDAILVAGVLPVAAATSTLL